MAFYPIDYSEPKNTCTMCGKLWEGNPFEYETDNHEFPCPECAAQQSVHLTNDGLTHADDKSTPAVISQVTQTVSPPTCKGAL